MGLFKRKPQLDICEMCDRTEVEGCGSANNHVVEIQADQPTWLPQQYRLQARGEYTWLCTRCHSFPAMKWPHEGGAWAGMMMHLGTAHSVGEFTAMGGQRIDMVKV